MCRVDRSHRSWVACSKASSHPTHLEEVAQSQGEVPSCMLVKDRLSWGVAGRVPRNGWAFQAGSPASSSGADTSESSGGVKTHRKKMYFRSGATWEGAVVGEMGCARATLTPPLANPGLASPQTGTLPAEGGLHFLRRKGHRLSTRITAALL